MRSLAVTTDLPISAERACAMAQRSAVFRHVVWPALAVRDRDVPGAFAVGEPFVARLWLAGGVVPGWRHEITVIEQTPTLLRTRERGGLLRTWNHELRFEVLGEDRCRYTDAVEIDAGLLTVPTVMVSRWLYRWRQRRWRRLAALVG